MHGRRVKMNYEQNVPGLQPLASSQYQPMAVPWADMSRAVGPMKMCTHDSSRKDGPDPAPMYIGRKRTLLWSSRMPVIRDS